MLSNNKYVVSYVMLSNNKYVVSYVMLSNNKYVVSYVMLSNNKYVLCFVVNHTSRDTSSSFSIVTCCVEYVVTYLVTFKLCK